jgi:hypothetical protein
MLVLLVWVRTSGLFGWPPPCVEEGDDIADAEAHPAAKAGAVRCQESVGDPVTHLALVNAGDRGYDGCGHEVIWAAPSQCGEA